MEINEFKQKYDGLNKQDQEVLQIITLIYEPEKISDIAKCIKRCSILANLSQNQCFKVIRNLEYQFIDNVDSKLSIEIGISNFVVQYYCLKNPSLELYRSIITDIFPVKSEKPYNWGRNVYSELRIYRDFRLAFYLDDHKGLEQAFRDYSIAGHEKHERFGLYLNLFAEKFSSELIQQIPDEYIIYILNIFLDSHYNAEVISYLEEHSRHIKNTSVKTRLMEILAYDYLRSSDLEKLSQLIKKNDIAPEFHLATMAFLRGNIIEAKKSYIEAVQIKLGKSKRKYCPPGLHGVYFAVAMLATADYNNKFLISALTLGAKEIDPVFNALKAYLDTETGNNNDLDEDFKYYSFSAETAPIAYLVMWLLDRKLINKEKLKHFHLLRNTDTTTRCDFLFYQYHTIATLIDKKYKPLSHEEEKLKNIAEKYLDISTLFKPEDAWKKALNRLKNIANKSHKSAAVQSERLVWLVDYRYSSLDFSPREQVVMKSGKWSKGRPVALKRIMNCDVSSMSAIDKQVASCISEEQTSTWGRYYEINYFLDTDRAMPYFLKHPYLFLESSPTTPVDLVKDDIQLIVKKRQSNFEISFSQKFNDAGIQIIRETPSRFKIIEVTETQMQIAKALGKKHRLVIPKETEPELKNIIANLSSTVPVHSDVKGGGNTKIITMTADTKPHIHLLPVGDGIRAEFFVRPFKNTGSFCKPGIGGKTIITEIKGKKKQANRNFSKEKEAAEAIIAKCPSLAARGNSEEIFNLETYEECLEVLLDLQRAVDDIVIEWPEGEKLRIRKQFSMSDMNVSITKSNDWFNLDASIAIDENTVLDLQQLVERAKNSRFIELSNGEFIALTDELKHKIESLSDFTYSSKGKSNIHPLNILAVDELTQDVNTKSDNKWKVQLKKAKKALSFQPELPSTFQAELRPYQLEGFNWLSRLANWGAGACLADDMGLGKTIQALAVVLEHAAKGPTLVVAPLSVCMNWIDEATRFTPTLNPILFGSDNRQDVIKNLIPFDLLICSYGLLLQESDLISSIHWQMTVLDEAQAIKNFKAKRTKAALNLKTDFKLITTGTPVENHLSEFWSLFNFINPGLLGSHQDFAAKFAVPIERDKNTKIRNVLKRITQPFLLRRTKAQVLDDLPPKTEINLTIDLSNEERAFYEALRRNSVENIENAKHLKGGAVHLKILAELTKLRLACCHPELITKGIQIESSKLSMFAEIVNDLMENRHKALVFSQFTSYLSLIRDQCDKQNINYQYLDGSTSIKERQTRVNNFQAGDGDLFLISLKAGGTGLNLTAADYVIHMDPWWNPAVEDQASDRAHRIGQQHPVTVYRFVTKGTVEEKIIALHKSKRELVDSLLDGAEMTGKMSADQLLALMRKD